MSAGKLRTDSRAPLREQVRDILHARIAEGELRPGDRLLEHDLAAELGISRVPVREAIRMLQSEGLLEVLPRRGGVFVRSLNRRELEELFDVREALEVLAARRAVEQAGSRRAGRMGELAEQARAALRAGETEEMFRANAAFHDELVALAGNELLMSMLEPLHGRLAWLFRLNLEPERVCREHEELHAAIVREDAEAAAEVALRHVRSSRRMVLDHLVDGALSAPEPSGA
ncbi:MULTISPECIES: GntR family transcriptional regulator [Prauserella salsuginis group]|uniref:DNA-binding GntR family transcriptional regulator n=2 Tax=Prauserella salsuginis group TaxID=2893672 RepID=A0A839XZ81_9PSEU|nr:MULTISPECIES: GntR family transcriptional regulator [Prauserella salsuginis group]MBB3665025.1 DNA-binding GntR family transcriptional regulator [Prauserella sediminis]MCR3718496.1 transcriptional regulator, GntR family [Prauserella flava]MCR3733066.1 transcriptional regulator, GntR family [Prauserella salsuginis]